MKRAMIYLLVLATVLSVGGILAFAAAENTEDLEQTLLALDYDVYTMESQVYEENTMAPDESMILLYSPEGYGIAASFDEGDVLILRFAPDSGTVEVDGQTGTFSMDGQKLTITDEDGWSAVFRPYEPGLEQLFVSMLLKEAA